MIVNEWMPLGTTFLFIFAIAYALLGQMDIFSGNKGSRAIIALVFGIVAALYSPAVEVIQGFLPLASIILVFIFLLKFVQKGLLSEEGLKDALPNVVMLGISLLLLGATWGEISKFIPMENPENILWIIGVVFIVMIFLTINRMQKIKGQND